MKYSYPMTNQTILAGVPVGNGVPVRIMGVINVSPESFFKGSVQDRKSIVKAARRMEEEGADFIDVGAMSTAPYLRTAISEAEEAERLTWAVRLLRKNCRLPISIDSMRAVPAEAGLEAGGRIINDVSGFRRDRRMTLVAKKADGLILMAHPDGLSTKFSRRGKISPVAITKRLLRQNLAEAARHHIKISRIVLDPGIGFFRGAARSWWRWDIEVLSRLDELADVGAPLLVGISRKSFIGYLLGGKPAEERLQGSVGAAVVAVMNGAALIRTHDVAATKEAVKVAEAILKAGRKGD